MGKRTKNQTLHLNYTTEESTGYKITKLKTHLRRSDRQIQASNLHSKTHAFKYREEMSAKLAKSEPLKLPHLAKMMTISSFNTRN